MARPGVQVTIRDSIPPRSQASAVDTWFVAGITEMGPSTPELVRSMSEYEARYGERTTEGMTMWDCLDVFFREGGSRAYIQRVVGADAEAATLDLSDADAPSVTVTAKSMGDFGNDLKVAVLAGVVSGVRLQITRTSTNETLETSPDFTTKADMLSWQSQYVSLSDKDVDEGIPVAAAAASLTGGDDDLDAIDDTSYTEALALFHSGLGAGQVSIPGNDEVTVAVAILDHAASHNRVALLDIPTTATDAAGIVDAVLSIRDAGQNERYGGMFGPYALVPGIVPATTRTVPYVAVQAGLSARQLNANEPAAGANGIARYALEVVQDFTDEDRETINEGGANIARNMLGGVRTYGYRTMADPNALPQWIQLNAIRAVMAIKAEAELIGEEHIFKQIDGRGVRIAAFQGALIGMLVPYFEAGALYGATPDEAFAVDCGAAVNTPETIANGELRANIALRTSPFGELVVIDIVKQALPTSAGQPLA